MSTRTLTDAERTELRSFIAADQARVEAENARMYAALEEVQREQRYSPRADEDTAQMEALRLWHILHPQAAARHRRNKALALGLLFTVVTLLVIVWGVWLWAAA